MTYFLAKSEYEQKFHPTLFARNLQQDAFATLVSVSLERRLKKDLRTAPAGSGVNSPPDSAPAQNGDHAVALLRRATKLPTSIRALHVI